MTTTQKADKVTTARLLKRVPSPNEGSTAWDTLRYEELGDCEVLAAYGLYFVSSPSVGEGGLIVRHQGELVRGYLSASPDGERVVVLNDAAVGGHANPVIPDSDPVARAVLSIKEGKTTIVNSRRGCKTSVTRYSHPTTSDRVVIGLR